jgi:hypothetical protein
LTAGSVALSEGWLAEGWLAGGVDESAWAMLAAGVVAGVVV